MKIETQTLEDRQTRLVAELDAEALEQYKRRAARKIAQQAKIPGFRPGKAPYDIVRRMYGDDAIQQEAVEIMVEDIYPQALKEANVEPYGPGKLDEIISTDPPKFAFVVPLAPEVVLGDYMSIRKDYAPEPVTDEQIEKTLTRLQRSYSTAEPVERPAQKGDMVSFKMSATRLNPAEGESSELLAESSYQMVAGDEAEDDQEKWPYEGFTNELIGLSANESKSWTHAFGDDTTFEDLKGKEAEFTVTVENVKELHLPALDDEFAHTVGSEYETLEDLKKTVRTQLEQNYTQQYEQNYFDELMNEMISQSTVQYPPQLLDREVDDFLHNVEHDLEHQQMDLDTYLKVRGVTKDEFIEKEVKPAAIRRLERSLVLSEFAEKENIQIDNNEMNQIITYAQQQAEQRSDLAQAQKGRKPAKSETNQMATLIAQSTANRLFNQLLLNRLKAIATGKGDEVPQAIEGPITLPDIIGMQAQEEAETPDEGAEAEASAAGQELTEAQNEAGEQAVEPSDAQADETSSTQAETPSEESNE